LGGRLVADAIRRADAEGRTLLIGVTANSHKVIDNLLLEAVRACSERGLAPAFMHVGPPEKVVDDPAIAQVKSGGVLMAGWIAENAGRHRVVGATKYAWSRPEVTMAADVLLIDEAGQFPLADALAALQSARAAIALGDPQQLSAPVQAAHDESVNLSVLEHLASGHDVLPEADGVFLDVSHRMHPAVCSVVGALAYEGELHSSPDAARRSIAGPAVATHGVTVDVRPGVSWVPLDADGEEEVDAVVDLVRGLVGSVTVTDADGSTAPLRLADVLVVAPHNAHVNRIQQALPDARVGTVDRFQGQQGHAVVYSMGRLAERAGDVRFLYELNRLNVALSRARLMAIVVSHRDAVFPPVADPEDLRLASRFIRAVGKG
ncbi:MAG: DEAD/DEAH box helicase, partial [Candidatus Nanopelagicales bacterium]